MSAADGPMPNPATTGEMLRSPEHRGRWLEDLGFLVAIIMIVAYVGLVEILPTAFYTAGVTDRTPVEHPFPWVLVVFVGLCIAPKMIGRARVGTVFEALAQRFGKKDGGG